MKDTERNTKREKDRLKYKERGRRREIKRDRKTERNTKIEKDTEKYKERERQ